MIRVILCFIILLYHRCTVGEFSDFSIFPVQLQPGRRLSVAGAGRRRSATSEQPVLPAKPRADHLSAMVRLRAAAPISVAEHEFAIQSQAAATAACESESGPTGLRVECGHF